MRMSGMGNGFNSHCYLDLDDASADVLTARRIMHRVPETTDTT